MTTFEFYRFRFHFRALDPVCFPAGKSANVVRGAFGMVLREAVPPPVYQRLFEPGAAQAQGPSGLADWPRPFVLRVAHLDSLTIAPGAGFFLDAHVFDLHQPALAHFRSAFARLADTVSARAVGAPNWNAWSSSIRRTIRSRSPKKRAHPAWQF